MTRERLFVPAILLLATLSSVRCIPIEIVYTGDGCECPKPLNYVVNVPPPPKDFIATEHGYKLDVPLQAKAKVSYTFDFIVQEPKTPPPVEVPKWDLVAKIDRITAHKKDCIAQECPSNTCSCNRCSRYVSPSSERAFARRYFHPNSLSKTQRPTAAITWAAILQPVARKSPTDASPMLKNRRRRDISRLLFPNRKSQSKKQSTKQYNRSFRLPYQQSARSLLGNFEEKLQAPLQQLGNLLHLPILRNKRDIKGEYDLIEKERDQMDLTLPEIIQYMPETLDPNFKRGQCQFDCKQQPNLEEAKRPNEKDSGNTLTSVDKEVNPKTDDSSDPNESKNDISASHTKRNAADFGYDIQSHNPHASPLSCYTPQSSYDHPITPNIPDTLPRPFALTQSQYGTEPAPQLHIRAPLSYQTPPVEASARSMEALPYGEGPYYNQPQPQPHAYNPYRQLDRVIADIIHRHSDFVEANAHDSKSDQEEQNKSLFKTLLSGKWQRYQLDDYNRPPTSYIPQTLYRK